MSPSRLEAVVKHDGRLNLLRCLLDGGPLSAPQLVARTGESVNQVRYWIRLLDTFDLIERLADPGGGEPLYALTLDEHPIWVREAIEEHRA